MDQCPESVDSTGQQGCIFVVRWHNDAESLVGVKVFREG